eukprot:4789678-Prymnesium_polylepis.1
MLFFAEFNFFDSRGVLRSDEPFLRSYEELQRPAWLIPVQNPIRGALGRSATDAGGGPSAVAQPHVTEGLGGSEICGRKHTWPGIISIDAGTAAFPPGSGLRVFALALREMPPMRAHNHLAPAPKEGENHDM